MIARPLLFLLLLSTCAHNWKICCISYGLVFGKIIQGDTVEWPLFSIILPKRELFLLNSKWVNFFKNLHTVSAGVCYRHGFRINWLETKRRPLEIRQKKSFFLVANSSQFLKGAACFSKKIYLLRGTRYVCRLLELSLCPLAQCSTNFFVDFK